MKDMITRVTIKDKERTKEGRIMQIQTMDLNQQ